MYIDGKGQRQVTAVVRYQGTDTLGLCPTFDETDRFVEFLSKLESKVRSVVNELPVPSGIWRIEDMNAKKQTPVVPPSKTGHATSV